MINKLWGLLILFGSVYLICLGKYELLNEQILKSGKTTFEMCMQLFPLISLWLGIMGIARKSGLLKRISKILEPILVYIFPDIPKGHEAFGYISSNLIANMFGLGNAATPFGIKAMESMNSINKNKKVASRSMITFLLMNTAGVTLVPTTIISLRMMHRSNNPSMVILPCLVVSFLSLVCSLIIDRLFALK